MRSSPVASPRAGMAAWRPPRRRGSPRLELAARRRSLFALELAHLRRGVAARRRPAPATSGRGGGARAHVPWARRLTSPPPRFPLFPAAVLTGAQETPRKFTQTIELQIGLKNYDPQKDKRFSGTVKLPYCPRPNMKVRR